MPVNYTTDYLKAQMRYNDARSTEEKILALEEMLKTCPSHKGAENLRAQLRTRLAQLCIIGFTNSGKSTLLSKLTQAKPAISGHAYTTKEPVVGMMDYRGVNVQLVEIPATFDAEYLSIARTSDGVVCLARTKDERRRLEELLEQRFVRVRRLFVDPLHTNTIKDRLWNMLNLNVVYTKTNKGVSPMALPAGSTVLDFAKQIHKDFIARFRFARLWRKGRVHQVGLSYVLENGDIVELHMRT